MKVLMLGWELPPYNSGGLGVACFQMCKALAKKDVDIDFVVPYTDKHDQIDFMKVTPALPFSVSSIQKTGSAYDSCYYVLPDGHTQEVDLYRQIEDYASGVEGLAKFNDFDVIHAHDWLTFRAGLRAKEMSGKPLIVHVHATEFDRAGGVYGNPLIHEMEYTGLMLADKIMAISQFTKDIIVKEYGIPPDKVEVVRNSLDIESYERIGANNSYCYLEKLKQQGYRVVVSIGRLTIQKGLTNLLMSAKEVIKRAPKTIFLIVGAGEQYHELISLSADLGISKNVVFTEFLRGKKWRDSFAIGDLFVLPSVSEPFGLTPLEAIGYGTPTLISKQSGVSEVIRHCLRVDFWDINEMANKITAVVLNDGLRDELILQGYKEYIRLSWDKAASKMFNAYNSFAVQGGQS
jgi:glycogen(starch) synthase